MVVHSISPTHLGNDARLVPLLDQLPEHKAHDHDKDDLHQIELDMAVNWGEALNHTSALAG